MTKSQNPTAQKCSGFFMCQKCWAQELHHRIPLEKSVPKIPIILDFDSVYDVKNHIMCAKTTSAHICPVVPPKSPESPPKGKCFAPIVAASALQKWGCETLAFSNIAFKTNRKHLKTLVRIARQNRIFTKKVE